MKASSAIVAASAVAANAVTLESLCTKSYISEHFPAADFFFGITIDTASINATYNTNFTATDNAFFPNTNFDYCSLTFSYSHNGRGDTVDLTYWLPDPAKFQNRFLATGGGGYAINSGTTETGSLPGGIEYGAVAGLTDGGFGIFQDSAELDFLLANGTRNYEQIYMFGYQAIHEMTVIGKELTQTVYGSNSTLYAYYQGCSEGGREGWSQVQRFPEQFHGATIGAPAFRFAFQQVQHLYSNVVEQDMNYFPSPCELEKVMNLTITFCDPLDGKTDGVVSRTDLCILELDYDTMIGETYSCAAVTGAGFGFVDAPATNGTITEKTVEIVKKFQSGLHTSDGKRAYFYYQPSSTYTDPDTQYNYDTDSFELDITSLGGSFVEVLINLKNASNLDTLEGVTVDTLRDWMYEGWMTYNDDLMANWPDLSAQKAAGMKIIHFHGESDYSIPTASSVHYWESVREVMNPGMSYNASVEAQNEFYRLFLVPGGSHCNYNVYEPNGGWPQTNLAVLIEWVEHGIAPVTLNSTVQVGPEIGENRQICGWPLRPLYSANGTQECVYNQTSLNTWFYDLNAFDMPVY